MLHQRTLGKTISAAGVGLHSGEKVEITLRPASENSGIRFRRVDCDPTQEIKAHANNVTDTRLGTTISQNNVSVMTVEHLLAAFAGLGIDSSLDINNFLSKSSRGFIQGNFDLENIRANFYEILGKEKFNTEDVNFIESEFNDLMLENGYKDLFNFQKFKVFLKSARDEKN